MSGNPSIFKHLRDVLILPFTVTVLVPYLIYTGPQSIIPDNTAIRILAAILFGGGLALFIYTVLLFHRFGKGTLAPWQPTQKLIVRGPYRYCRNPMISGVLFILCGQSFWLQSTNILLWALLFFTVNTLYFIRREEPDMQKRFGSVYERYKSAVPRWLPRFRPYKPD